MGMCVAHADYLNWMVGSNPVTTESGDLVDWTSAAFFQDGTQLGDTLTTDDFDLFEYGIATLGEGYSSSLFRIELYKGSDGMVAWSSFNGSALAGYVYGDGSVAPIGDAAPRFAPASFIPEPTSGMLFLLGGMLLGLKRRRQA